MINITTIAGLVVFFGILIFIANNIRKRGIDILSVLLVIVDFTLLLMLAFQEMTYEIINSLGFWRPEIAFLSIISITAFFLAVKSYFNQRELERDITLLTRKIALKNKKENS